jgi:hypothetical protein
MRMVEVKVEVEVRARRGGRRETEDVGRDERWSVSRQSVALEKKAPTGRRWMDRREAGASATGSDSDPRVRATKQCCRCSCATFCS